MKQLILTSLLSNYNLIHKNVRAFTILILVLFAGTKSYSQEAVKGESHVAIEQKTINLKQLAEQEKVHPPVELEKKVPNQYGEEGEEGESEEEEEGGIPRYRKIPPGAIIYREDNTVQNRIIPPVNQTLSPAPSTNFNGLDDNNGSIPPDVNGAVGPNHLMVTLNTEYRIQTRAGATVSTVAMSTFWGSLSGVSGTFDPKTLYDPYNNRWIAVAVSNSRSASSAVLVGVSQTNDPTGSWNLYKIDATPADTMWLDYPSVGFNKDWIVITGNFFGNVGGNFQASNAYVLKKSVFYAGAAGQYTSINAGNNVFTLAPAITYDNTISTMYLVQTWDGSTGDLQMYTITGAFGSEVLTPGSFVHTDSLWAYGEPVGNDFAPQSTVANKFQCNDDRMLNCIYRNGSIWCAHTVFLPMASPTRCSLQWWRLTTAGAITSRNRIDDPTGVNFYAFPSLTVNASNDALLGYAKFSASTFASAGYSLKLTTDANFQSDFVFKAGAAKYFKTFSGSRNRWGDYTLTQVDPLNDNDFWTLGEYASTASGGFDRWGTWWASVSVVNPPVANFSADKTTACTNSNVIFTSSSTGTITSYAWNFGVGATPATSTSSSPVTVQYSSTGLKTISLTVTGPLGSNGITKTNYVNVITPPVAAGTISGSSTVCQGQTNVAYSVPLISGATGYSWTLPSGASIAGGANTNSILVTFASSAVSGTISVMGTNAGCSGTPSSFAVTVTSIPSKTGTLTFTGSSITINDVSTATPYPSNLVVSGFTGNVQDVNVILTGFSHTWKGDVDILLESPDGTKMILMSDCGEAASGTTGINLTFNDSVAGSLPPTSLVSGTFKPTNYGSPDNFPAPGPGSAAVPPYASLLSIFNGFIANGTWKLYVVDDGTGDVGSITSWSLKIIGPVPNDPPVISGTSSICKPQNGVAYSIPAVNGATSYAWSLPANASIASGANTNSITVNFSASAVSGNITVTPSNICGNSTASGPFAVTVNSTVAAAVSIAAVPPGAICSGTNVTFTAVPTGGGTTPAYQWKKNGINVGSNSTIYSNNALVNADSIKCVMTSNAVCATPNPSTSNVIRETVNVCNLTISLKVFIEGFYTGNGQMNPVLYTNGLSANPSAADSVTLELHNAVSPYNLAYSKKALLNTSGNGSFLFPAVVQGSYYIAITHRNGLETWSKNPVSLFSSPFTFDFTSP